MDIVAEASMRPSVRSAAVRSAAVRLTTLAAALAAALTVSAPPASAAVTPPSAVTSLQTGTVSATSVELSWWPAGAGTNPVAGYDVYAHRAGTGAPDRIVLSTTTAGAYVTVGGLTPATAYRMYVRARDTAGVRGGASPVVTVTTLAADRIPGPPVATAVTSTTAMLTWAPPAVGADRIAEYYVTTPARTPTQPVRLWARTSGSVTTATLTGLSPGTAYTVVVLARFTDGSLPGPSPSGTFTTLRSVPPSAPADLVVSDLTSTSATLSWSPAAPGDFPIARYLLNQNGVPTFNASSNADTRTWALTFAPGSTNTVYVVAVDTAGVSSAPSAAVTFTAPA
jgi:chitodextrinase